MDLDQPTPETPCLDDYPEPARLGVRQQFINRWSQPLAFVPILGLSVAFNFLPVSGKQWIAILALPSLLWAMGVLSYSLYIRFFGGIHCPACNHRFGSRDACRNCSLPRHRRTPFLLPKLTADD